jgi:hypothetical protein
MVYKVNHYIRTLGDKIALAALILGIAATAPAQSTESSAKGPAGRIDFEAANLPTAKVEVDLSQEMFKDLFGLGDAAIAGVAETLMNSREAKSGPHVEMAAEQLEAARQIIQLASNVVQEVRVRVFEGSPEGASDAQQLIKPFDEQLQSGKWETLVRVRDKDEIVRVSVLRREGAVQGVFVAAVDGEDVVFANAVCDISPDNVKKITSAATKIGLENGLAQQIEAKMKRLPGKLPSAPVGPSNAEDRPVK